MLALDGNFSGQQIEERCAVLFWLLRNSEKKRNVLDLGRFATNEFCQSLAYEIDNDSFGRFAAIASADLESVSLRGIDFHGENVYCYVLVVWSAAMVARHGAASRRPVRDVLVLSRPRQAVTRVNSVLSSSHCANCGGPLASSYAPSCAFCGSIVNDGSEWILSRMIKESEPEYQSLTTRRNALRQDVATNSGGEAVVEKTVSANDLITISAQILMADGRIEPAEMAMLNAIAKKYHISEEALADILESVKNGLVHVPVPKVKSFGALGLIQDAVKMALADAELAEDEKIAVMNLGMQLGYSKLDVQQIINAELTALKRLRQNQKH
jgi:uncharacterized tellurite resistance protein B-like protein